MPLAVCCGVSVGFLACTHRPVEELTLADVAMKAAQKAKADQYAPDTFRKAENYFLRAKKDFTEGYFDSSRKYSDDARRAAEQAEYQALVKQAKMKGPQEEVPNTNDAKTVSPTPEEFR